MRFSRNKIENKMYYVIARKSQRVGSCIILPLPLSLYSYLNVYNVDRFMRSNTELYSLARYIRKLIDH